MNLFRSEPYEIEHYVHQEKQLVQTRGGGTGSPFHLVEPVFLLGGIAGYFAAKSWVARAFTIPAGLVFGGIVGFILDDQALTWYENRSRNNP